MRRGDSVYNRIRYPPAHIHTLIYSDDVHTRRQRRSNNYNMYIKTPTFENEKYSMYNTHPRDREMQHSHIHPFTYSPTLKNGDNAAGAVRIRDFHELQCDPLIVLLAKAQEAPVDSILHVHTVRTLCVGKLVSKPLR